MNVLFWEIKNIIRQLIPFLYRKHRMKKSTQVPKNDINVSFSLRTYLNFYKTSKLIIFLACYLCLCLFLSFSLSFYIYVNVVSVSI